MIYLTMTFYIYSKKKKIIHCKKLNGINSYSFQLWMKTDQKASVAADVAQCKHSVGSFYGCLLEKDS